MLYTKRGDDGTTKTYGCDQRISKSSAVAEALGSLDEVNFFTNNSSDMFPAKNPCLNTN
ncbi:ATP:cob(I)alamin adenosyltransferase [Streptococcus pneumoniae]|uniref:ATP:cob(I)alamin adenosyltransferase n=1 Tax=Streptococcus pneumoniae TaxID=1313 RepID=UPI00344BD48D